jgi:hypothetical protein
MAKAGSSETLGKTYQKIGSYNTKNVILSRLSDKISNIAASAIKSKIEHFS